eukprot:PITA_09121
MVTKHWTTYLLQYGQLVTNVFANKLLTLKHKSIEWEKEKGIKDENTLRDMELELEYLGDREGQGFVSFKAKERLIKLEMDCNRILKDQEETWHLRSHAICRLFRAPPEVNLAEIIKVADHFPIFVDQEVGEGLLLLVTMGEFEDTLKWFKNDKSHRPDGWLIEFYLSFFDILGNELLQIIEYCQTRGWLYDAFNLTFISLIPKTDDPQSFNDFRSISLCNCIYKIIAKLITNRLKPILSKHISPEKFAFIDHHHIHEAVGIAQEAIHSIKTRKLKGMVLKIDLAKAFDIPAGFIF